MSCRSIYFSLPKSGVPKPVTYGTRSQSNVENEETSLAEHTGSHPSMALNPLVSQPGFEPSVMSMNPSYPSLYSQRLRNPSGGSPFEIRKSFNNEITPAAVYTQAISWVPEDE